MTKCHAGKKKKSFSEPWITLPSEIIQEAFCHLIFWITWDSPSMQLVLHLHPHTALTTQKCVSPTTSVSSLHKVPSLIHVLSFSRVNSLSKTSTASANTEEGTAGLAKSAFTGRNVGGAARLGRPYPPCPCLLSVSEIVPSCLSSVFDLLLCVGWELSQASSSGESPDATEQSQVTSHKFWCPGIQQMMGFSGASLWEDCNRWDRYTK